jgi:hypothetical protein
MGGAGRQQGSVRSGGEYQERRQGSNMSEGAEECIRSGGKGVLGAEKRRCMVGGVPCSEGLRGRGVGELKGKREMGFPGSHAGGRGHKLAERERWKEGEGEGEEEAVRERKKEKEKKKRKKTRKQRERE